VQLTAGRLQVDETVVIGMSRDTGTWMASDGSTWGRNVDVNDEGVMGSGVAQWYALVVSSNGEI
jgi:hypothetical protein